MPSCAKQIVPLGTFLKLAVCVCVYLHRSPHPSNMHKYILLFLSVLSAAIALAPRPLPSPKRLTTPSNTTLPTSITAPFPGSLTNGPLEPECLQQSSAGHMMQQISIVHCYELLTHLLANFSPSPVPWNTPDYPVPEVWTRGTCMISFERLSLSAWDVFSELQIAKAAAVTVVRCVTADTRWLGGRVRVGPRMGFQVAVFGRGEMPRVETEVA